MSRHEWQHAVADMRDHASEAIQLAGTFDRSDADAERVLELALARLVEIIGEAASRVPEVVRGRHTGIPWRSIVGARNRLIHGYDAVDQDILWRIVDAELPDLVRQLDDLLAVEGVSHRE